MSDSTFPPVKPADDANGDAARRSGLLERYLVPFLCAASALALWWPGSLPVDPFLATAGAISWLVAGTMFFVGWMLPERQVSEVLRRGHLVAAGVALQYVSMPLLAWSVASVFGLEGAAWIGLMLVGAVPGAMASNVLTLNARGNASFSVSLTTVATLLSPLMVPLALSLTLGQDVQLDPIKVMRTLVLTVVLPVVAGHGLRRLRPEQSGWADRVGPVAANLTILWIIAVVVAKNREHLLGQGVGSLLAPLLMLNLAGYAIGYLGGVVLRMDEPMRRALTLEIGMQNAGVGTMLAMSLFSDASIALAPALYTFGCMLTGAMLARWWAGMNQG